MKIIIHMDIDSFFASAAVFIDPSLKGKPLVISSGKSRAIVSSASYEARKFGIHAGMPIFKAKKLCPDLVYALPSSELYYNLSSTIFKILSQNKKIKIEIASIDECYLDVTNIVKSWNQAKELSLKWQKLIYSEVRLDVSFGISFNKFAAKMATNLEKPRGISIITKENFQSKLWNENIASFYGIGKKTLPRLNRVGIYTIGDLAKRKYHESELGKIFGKAANSYIDLANGMGNNEISEETSDPKSISKTEAFIEGPIVDWTIITKKLKQFSRLLEVRLKNRDLVSLNVSLNISYGRNHAKKVVRTRQKKLRIHIFTAQDIYDQALTLLNNEWKNREPIRQIGIGVNNLINKYDAIIQQSIYDVNEESTSKLQNIVNKINSKFRHDVLMLGSQYYSKQRKISNSEKNRADNNSSFLKKTMI